MKTLIKFFEETPGVMSSQRLIFIVGSFYAMLMGAWVYHQSNDYTAVIAVVGSLSATFGVQKLVQKYMEPKEQENKDKTDAAAH